MNVKLCEALTVLFSDQDQDLFVMFPVSHPKVTLGHSVSSKQLSRGREGGRRPPKSRAFVRSLGQRI